MKKTILSASTSSGELSLGNYIGAIRNWLKLQEQSDQFSCYYMVADLHALTTQQDPEQLKKRTLSLYAQYLACGLDPKKNCIFVQSQVPTHAQLSWVLTCLTPMGQLSRMTQFKDKSQKNSQNINGGLLTYPVLMAADILLYQADLVPVGEDQKQHLELTRDLVQIFHHRYGEVFKMPSPYIAPKGAKIMSLQEPNKKMSKSDENSKAVVSLVEPSKSILKKFKSAVTDSGSCIEYDKKNKPGVSNLIDIYCSLKDIDQEKALEHFSSKMYGHLKLEVGELVVSKLEPIREKYEYYLKDLAQLEKIMNESAAMALEKSQATLDKVYQKIGLIK